MISDQAQKNTIILFLKNKKKPNLLFNTRRSTLNILTVKNVGACFHTNIKSCSTYRKKKKSLSFSELFFHSDMTRHDRFWNKTNSSRSEIKEIRWSCGSLMDRNLFLYFDDSHIYLIFIIICTDYINRKNFSEFFRKFRTLIFARAYLTRNVLWLHW